MAKKSSDAGVLVKARVLADVLIDGVRYSANDVTSIDSALCDLHVANGSLDATSEGVAYCEGELGAKARDHAAEAAPIAAAIAAQAEANATAAVAQAAADEAKAKAELARKAAEAVAG